MALENLEFKDQIGLICEGRKIVKREKKRGGRGREDGGAKIKAKKVWKLTLFMNPMRLCMNVHALMVILLPKSKVFARVSY